MDTGLRVPPPSTGATPILFHFDEPLCLEVLTRLQSQWTSAGAQVHFGRIQERGASLYMVCRGSRSYVLWLCEDYVRDWFVARYSQDGQQAQEIEQEIISDLNAQLAALQ